MLLNLSIDSTLNTVTATDEVVVVIVAAVAAAAAVQ